MKRKVSQSGAEIFYSFTFGPEVERLAPGVKNVRHAPFQHCRPYGDAYAYISSWMSDHVSMGEAAVGAAHRQPAAGRTEFAPDWGFPEDAVVLGRHGGYDQFDLPFVHGAVAAALERRPDLHFAFLNTRPFIRHERVRFLEPVYDLVEKSNFIASCDAMLHARKAGEGFGLAPAEFLFFDKPVNRWEGGKDRNRLPHRARPAPRLPNGQGPAAHPAGIPAGGVPGPLARRGGRLCARRRHAQVQRGVHRGARRGRRAAGTALAVPAEVEAREPRHRSAWSAVTSRDCANCGLWAQAALCSERRVEFF